jgi:hypothetical protein
MMADRSAHRRTGDSVPAADLMAGDCTGRGPFSGAGGFVVTVGRRVGTKCEADEYGSQNHPSHYHLQIVVRIERATVTGVAARFDDRSVLLQMCPAGG